ncbi:MAG: DUF1573 domain-containing protein [Pirellulales bacterium]|nr:DUF1573 domain-containing protein [Pirellulales bacterium]
MYRSALLFLTIVTFCTVPVLGQQWATDMFETTNHDFGTVARGAKAQFEFRLTNRYLEDVHIASVHSSCGCTEAKIEKPLLKTYETGAIIATVNTRAFQGQRGATLTVTIDKPYYAQVQLHDSVYIRSDVVFEPGSVLFGEVDEGQAVEKKVSLNYAGRGNWQVVDVRSDNPHISGRAVETGRQGGRVSYDLIVRVDKNAPAGYLRDHLMLKTNDNRMTQVPLLVEGRVVSGVTVSPASLFLGVVQPGETVQKRVVVRGRKPFKILSIQCDDEHFKFDKAADTEAKALHLVPVTYVGSDNAGKVARTIYIQTDLGTTASDLPAYAVVTDQNE